MDPARIETGAASPTATTEGPRLELGRLALEPGGPGALFSLVCLDEPGLGCVVEGPSLDVDGLERGGFEYVGRAGERVLGHGGREVTLRYRSTGSPDLELPDLELLIALRCYPGSCVLRLRYRLSAEAPASLTKRGGQDAIRYLTVRPSGLDGADLTEVQLSHFDPVAHSYMPNLESHAPDELYPGLRSAGPIVLLHRAAATLLAAYEHGADHPQSFLEFELGPGANGPELALLARKGNHFHKQAIGPATAWESAWLELGMAPVGRPAFLEAYRRFLLAEMCENAESRRPSLYYNTWNFQERNRYFNGRPYLESMTLERMLAEIEVARRIGIDTFVIDTGWFDRTGDWRVNLERFPDGLREVKRRLDAHGMKLGLWLNPTVAALTSEVFQSRPDLEMTRGGQPAARAPIWETEVSASMCLASDYADWHVETMVRLHEELGVTYFKWDGISQYGCDSPHHHHGSEANPPEERAECYAYQMGLSMLRMVEEVSRRCPGVVVDFDITEGGRFVGLGFLSVGKYFLVNNGPYFADFDIPPAVRIEPNTINAFFYPGAARSRVCRQGVKYDPVVPSILFLTHFLPDGPAASQRNSLASLILGGNGVWGDLLTLSEADVAFWAEHLGRYKRAAEAATRAYPRSRGFAGSSPEVHEKLDPETASGLLGFFTVTPGPITHLTRPINTARLETVLGADAWEATPDDRLKLVVNLERDDARVVFVVGR